MNVLFLLSDRHRGARYSGAVSLMRALRADGHTALAVTRPSSEASGPLREARMLAASMAMRGLRGSLAPMKIASLLNKLDGRTAIHTYCADDARLAAQARRLAGHPEQVTVVCSPNIDDAPRLAAMADSLDAVACTSQAAFDALRLTFGPEKTYLIPAAPDMTPFEGPKDADPPLIAFVGRIVPENGLDTLVSALATLKDLDWRLTVCGAGRGRTVMPIVRAARSHGINDRIEWAGHTDDVEATLRRAAIAVFPRRSWSGSQGLAALEAASQGCAVLATPGCPTLPADALLETPPDRPDLLAEALRRLLTDADLRRQFIERAMRHVAAFNEHYAAMTAAYNSQTCSSL